MKDFKSEIKDKFINFTENIKNTMTDKGLFAEKPANTRRQIPVTKKYNTNTTYTGKRHVSKKSYPDFGFRSPNFSGFQGGIENAVSFIQRHYVYFIIGAVAAIAIPIIAVASTGNAQVVIISGIEADAATTISVQDDSSDLFEGITEENVQDDTAITANEGNWDMSDPEAVLGNVTTFIRYDIGMTADFITKIQERLMDLDYLERDEPTDYYGPATKQAISYFQRKNGMDQDGVAGEETQRVLFSTAAKSYVVSEGDEGDDVESIQQRLKDLHYNISVTGFFGSDTTKAVAYFQRMSGLSDDGSVGTQTKEALFAENAETSIEYKEQLKEEARRKAAAEAAARKKSGKKSSGGSSKKGGGSSKKGGTSTKYIADPGSVESFIEVAESMAGVPYVRAGKSTSGVDCSGFVYVALKNSGNGIGYMTSGGWAGSGYPTVYSMSELQRGDIVCFSGHVGIYLGGGGMIDASSSQGRVRYCSNIQGSSYWTSHFICGKRPL